MLCKLRINLVTTAYTIGPLQATAPKSAMFQSGFELPGTSWSPEAPVDYAMCRLNEPALKLPPIGVRKTP